MAAAAPADVDELLGGLHEWRDVQTVVRTTFQALYDVAHAQSRAVREVERRVAEVQEDLAAAVGRKADATGLRTAESAASEARRTVDLLTRRVDEEAECSLEARRLAAEEAQTLRAGLGDLRAVVERQRAELQQLRACLEAGLARLAAECAGTAQAMQAECHAAWQRGLEELRAVVDEKATPAQLADIVREAWHREEGQLARLQRMCESKVSTGDFAALAALAENKASMADVNAVVQRHVSKRLSAMVTDQELLAKSDVAAAVEAVGEDAREKLRLCEHRVEEVARKQQRFSAGLDELRVELRGVGASKVDRSEAEALVAGALGDWVRAAQRGADAVQIAVHQGWGRHAFGADAPRCGFGASTPQMNGFATPARTDGASQSASSHPHPCAMPNSGMRACNGVQGGFFESYDNYQAPADGPRPAPRPAPAPVSTPQAPLRPTTQSSPPLTSPSPSSMAGVFSMGGVGSTPSHRLSGARGCDWIRECGAGNYFERGGPSGSGAEDGGSGADVAAAWRAAAAPPVSTASSQGPKHLARRSLSSDRTTGKFRERRT